MASETIYCKAAEHCKACAAKYLISTSCQLHLENYTLLCRPPSTPLPPVRQTACCDPVILSAVRQGLSDIQGSRGVPRRVANSQCTTITCLPTC